MFGGWWSKSPEQKRTPKLSDSTSTASSADSDGHSQPDPLSPGTASDSGFSPSERERVRSDRSEIGLGVDDLSSSKRAGLTGAALSTLSTALDAAIFTSALGYSAYQLWKHPPGDEDVDLVLARSKSQTGHSQGRTRSAEPQPPPPYSTLVSAAQCAATSRSHRQSTLSPQTHQPASQPAEPAQAAHDPFSSLDLLQHSTPQFLPFAAESPQRDGLAGVVPGSAEQAEQAEQAELDSDEAEQDAEMELFAERLKSLIELGTEALASRPKVLSTSPTRSLIVEESRPLPPPVTAPPTISRHARRQSAIPVPASSLLSSSTSRGAPSKLPMPTSPKQPRTPRLSQQWEATPSRRHAKRESISGAIPLPAPRSAARLPTTAELETPSRSGTPSRHAARSSWAGEDFLRSAHELERPSSKLASSSAGWRQD